MSHIKRILLLLALLVLPSVASAQHIDEATTEQPTLADRFMTDFARMTIEFWTPKLNSYRIEIDRMLTASDLVEVKELRTRTALLLERIQEMQKREREERSERYSGAAEGNQYHMDSTAAAPAVPVPDNSYYEAATDTAMAGSGVDEEAMSASEARDLELEWERAQEEHRKSQLRRLEQALAGNLEEMDSPYPHGNNNGEPYMYGRELEHYQMREGMNEIRYVTRWIARNYRPGMEELLAKIFIDLDEFFEASRLHAREFITSNGVENLEDEDLVERILQTMRAIREVQGLKSETGPRAAMAKSIIESILMVYNGQDLREIFMIDGGPVASSSIEKLPPAGNTLGQNMPNPASSRTTIPYTLNEPGSSVVLQLLDTRGYLVGSFDQGARAIGSHSAVIDVTTLPPGTYLYQLKVMTLAGEMVSSKGMQVVR